MSANNWKGYMRRRRFRSSDSWRYWNNRLSTCSTSWTWRFSYYKKKRITPLRLRSPPNQSCSNLTLWLTHNDYRIRASSNKWAESIRSYNNNTNNCWDRRNSFNYKKITTSRYWWSQNMTTSCCCRKWIMSRISCNNFIY